jgi:hypothetical protein
MSDEWVTTKEILLQHIERDWNALQGLLHRLTTYEMTEVINADGWSAKDHVVHLTIWERSVISFLTGVPRHEAMGLSEALYLSGDLDAMNEAIFKAHREQSLAEVQSQFRATHDALMRLLASLTTADLSKPYSHYLADEPVDGDYPAINVVYGNTAHHFRTHQRWIEETLRSSTGS